MGEPIYRRIIIKIDVKLFSNHFLSYIKMSQVITSNGEKFIKSSYNGFSILIREKDNYINATKMVREINQITNKKKQLKTIFKSYDYQDFIKELDKIEQGKILPCPKYEIDKGYINEIKGSDLIGKQA